MCYRDALNCYCGMVCEYYGRHPEQKKHARILDWPVPQSTKEANAFISVIVYYKIFIVAF